jgi:2-dehydropantoate 2-reductase
MEPGTITLAPSPSLRIAVLGAGKIGSTFAFQLARIGRHDVTVIARPGSIRLEQLRRDEAIIDLKGGRANVRVADMLDEQTPYDLVVVTLLAHQTDAVLPALQRSVAKCIQFMFNNFHPERLQEAVGVERCSFGMPFVQATLDGDGKLKAAIGAAGQKTLMSQQRWVDVFNAAGLPAAVERNMPLWLRCHAPLCVAFESVSVAGERRGGGASWGEAIVLARGIHASFMLIKGLGHPVYPRTKKLIDRSPASAVAAMLWSMSRVRSFRELLATGKAECIALVDTMVAAASLANGPVVVSDIQAMKPL